MHSHIGIAVSASPRRVFELANQVPRWAELLPHYRQVTIESQDGDRTVARMAAWRPGLLRIPVSWRAEHWSDDTDETDLRLHFRHVGGATVGMQVVWHIRPTGSGTSVVIEHDFSRPLPLLGSDLMPAIVDRFFIRPIAGRTLATFQALAEGRAA
jgi:ribosome-associated toxin RatA of RatAB toxin-antitoxin module